MLLSDTIDYTTAWNVDCDWNATIEWTTTFWLLSPRFLPFDNNILLLLTHTHTQTFKEASLGHLDFCSGLVNITVFCSTKRKLLFLTRLDRISFWFENLRYMVSVWQAISHSYSCDSLIHRFHSFIHSYQSIDRSFWFVCLCMCVWSLSFASTTLQVVVVHMDFQIKLMILNNPLSLWYALVVWSSYETSYSP